MAFISLWASQLCGFIRERKGMLLMFYTICFLLYLGIGGLLFMLIEGPKIEKTQIDIIDVKFKIIEKYPNIPEEALDDYLKELKSLGIRGLPEPKGKITKWTFADAVFFSATLLTTIGYGHVSPKLILGKVVCILYTGIGIPVTLLLLSAYVNQLMKISESYKAMLFQKLQYVLKPFYIRFTHIASIMAMILLVCFILPSFIFSHLENEWGLFDGIYYCFISLTTVGLGDLVPALNSQMPYVEIYKHGATLFMIAGITIMMFMMAMTADFQQNYNCCYETLPFIIPREQIPINPNSVLSYGSILTQSGKSENENIEKLCTPDMINEKTDSNLNIIEKSRQ